VSTQFLRLVRNQATGIEISDTTFRFITLEQEHDAVLPVRAAELAIPAGCLENGRIANKKSFIEFLKRTKKSYKFDRAHLVLATSQIQTLSVSTKGAAPLYIKEVLEKEFGMPAKDLVYEYHAIGGDGTITVLQVVALPKVVSEEFVNAFRSAGIVVENIESLGHAVSRAVLPIAPYRCAMIIAIDSEVTSMTMVVNGKVSQTTMFAFGDMDFINTIATKLSVSAEEANTLKQEQGLIAKNSRDVFDAVGDDCVALVKHINEVYIAWHTAHNTLAPLETIYLTGPGSLLRGLDEYVSVGLRAPVIEANVWGNCLSFDDHVPSLPQFEAIRYGTVIGTVLSSADSVNLLPYSRRQALHRKRLLSVTAKIAVSFILGVAVGFVVARAMAMPDVRTQFFALLHKIQARW
jgi:Tfp pilus assembly PilM family ATPase